MSLFHIIILALVQGITEFLPISSSGHLVLTHKLMGEAISQQSLQMDIAVHVGTLFAVLLYFRADVAKIFHGFKDFTKGQRDTQNAKLGLYVLLGSLPVLFVGGILSLSPIIWLHSAATIAWTTLIFGILLWVVDAKQDQKRTLPDMNAKRALFIGLAQVLALIPGTSRSGITITAARYLGFTRTEAARYSLLLAVIAISGAGTLGGFGLLKANDLAFTLDILLAAALAFIAALITISLMMKWLSKASFAIFGIYRIILGLVLLGAVYWGVL